jgi:hypothetical protein
MMKVRKHVLLWMLPLLALRALVPAGFMIDTSHGAMSVVVCPGHQTQSPHGATSDDATSDDATKAGNDDSVSICAFAAAAGAALASDVPTVSLASALAGELLSNDVTALDLPFGPTRTQQSRAPPYFS